MQMTGMKGAHLSRLQERLWGFWRESNVYRAQCAISLEGKLEERACLDALQQVVNQQEILRSTFYCPPGMDMPIQAINQGLQVSCPVVNIEGLEPELQHELMKSHFIQLREVPFDLAQGLQLRSMLFRCSALVHQLFLSLPALSADAPTLPLLISEWSQQYQAYRGGQEPLLEEPLQYVDVSAWQEELQASEHITQQEFWRKLDLPALVRQQLSFAQEPQGVDRALSLRQQAPFEPCTFAFDVEDAVALQLDELARQSKVSISSLLLAYWSLLLGRLLDQEELILGVAGDGRIYEELANVLGLFTRYIPIKLHYDPQCSQEQFLYTTDQSLKNALERQLYFSWDDLAAEDVQEGYFPLAFEHEHWPNSLSAAGLVMSLSQSYSCTEPFLLKLRLLQTGTNLQINLQYDLRRIASVQVVQMATMLATLLREAVAKLQQPIGALEILAPAEKNYLLDTFRGPVQSYEEKLLHQLFEAQVTRSPDRLAVVTPQVQLTYQELNRRANQLACLLRDKEVLPNTLVGLCVSRSPQMLIALLAILKAGGAYVPLDPESPALRLEFQLHDTQAHLLITQRHLLSRVASWDGQIVCLDTLQEELAQLTDCNTPAVSTPQDLAYVIYTSGSTGVPKGVMIQQRSVSNYTLALCDLLCCEPGWQYATVSTLAADLGNTAIFCSIASGGCLHILDYETIVSKEAFAHWTTLYPIDVLKIVPSHLAALLSDNDAANALLPARSLILGGEVLPPALLEQLRNLDVHCHIYNHYGPTETTIGVLVSLLSRSACKGETFAALPGHSTIPLGRAIANTDVYILDGWQQVVPIGVTGELYIGGTGVAMGYWRLPEQTAARFVPHPFSQHAGARLYRTGDLARYMADGQVEFVGRRDRQVKLRGYRVELREIEAMLRQHPNVWDSVALLREDLEAGPCIVGYIVPRQFPAPTNSELHNFMREHLPEYMVPAHYVPLKVFPLTPNGKVDWHQLPKPEAKLDERDVLPVLPRNPVEEILWEIWKELLAVPALGIHDNFFQIGGHSLLGTQLMARLRKVLQIELPLRSLFDAPTVAQMAQQVLLTLQGQQPREELPLVAVARTQDFPLSFAQQRLWFLYQLEPQSTAYLLPRAQWLTGPLDCIALQRACQSLVARHESLRTTFPTRDGHPRQCIQPAASVSFLQPLIDLSALSSQSRSAAVRSLVEQEAQVPCDLSHGPLLRSWLLRVASQEHVLLLTMHHIISDAWSNEIFLRELTSLYQAQVSGKLAQLPPLPIQYADFALWQRQWLQGEVLENQLSYWRQHLAGISPLNLPADHPRPPVQTTRGASLSLPLPSELLQQLRSLSLRQGVTLFMTLLAAFQVLLARYSGQSDISVGTPIANRTRTELEGLIGFFANTLVMRTDLAGNPTFIELLSRVREVTLGAYAHQDVPFEHLVEALQTQRDLSRTPLFQVMFSMQEHTAGQEPGDQSSRLTRKGVGRNHTAAKFDLTFSVMSSALNLQSSVDYNADLFETETIERLLAHWQILLESIVAAPQTALSDLSLLSIAERQQLLFAWNAQPEQQVNTVCLHTLFEQQAMRQADAIAVVCGEDALTYGQLNARANQLAYALCQAGVGAGSNGTCSETMVGLALERSPLLIIGILGVLKAGGAYVPLDPSYPAERLEFMCSDARISVLLTQQSLREKISIQGVQTICLDRDWPVLASGPAQNPLKVVEAQQIAYVIYTSGSTGRPKGVMVNHANVASLFAATRPSYHFNEHDVWTLFHSSAFDFSVWEIWGALLYGGQLLVVPYAVSRTPETFYALLATHNVTVLNQTPSAFRQLMQLEMSMGSQKQLALRLLIFGGEALDLQSLRPWFERHGEQEPQLINMYGITETTVHVTNRLLSVQDVLNAAGSVIGVPLPSLQVYVLDEYLQPVPIGIPGQMYVGGLGLSRGYLNHPELTGERFIPHPFSTQPGMRLYKTGDQARFLPNGDLEYLGRVDQQVKIRGFRIETGEIEEVMRLYPTVRECVVVAQEDGTGHKRLVAYVVAQQGTSPGSGELRSFLLGKVPDYMVPAFFVALEELPLTANGKLDQRALPQPGGERPEGGESYVEPRTRTEEVLAGIWSKVLGIEQVGIHDNFFALGGDSIRSIQILSQARERGVNFSLQQLFQYQTIYELVQILGTEENSPFVAERVQPYDLISAQDRERLPADVEDAYPLSMLQAGMVFHNQYNPGSAVYHDITAYHLQTPFKLQSLKTAIQRLVACHPIMRTSFELSSFSEPLQLVHRTIEMPLPVIDLRQFSPREQTNILVTELKNEKSRPFDERQAPLIRFQIHLRSESSFQFTLSFHHAVLDGWSVASLVTELFRTYRSILQGEHSIVRPAPTIQFRDFVALERRLIVQGEAQRYWSEKLSDSTVIALPRWAAPEQVTDSSAVYVLPIPIAPEVSTDLKKLAQTIAVPLKSVLLAVHCRVLSLLSGQPDVITGLVSNGRPETTDGERILGLFLNTLPLRLRLSGGTWVELVQETFAAECELLPYRWYPLANIQRQQGGYDLFEIVFNFTHFHVYQEVLEKDNRTNEFQVSRGVGFEKTNFTLVANFSQDLASSQIRLSLRCNTTEIGREQIKAIGTYYANALTSIVSEPYGRYALQSPLPLQERQQLLVDWNATNMAYQRERGIHELFEDQVRRTPETIALVLEDVQLTYMELNRCANQLAYQLRDLGVGPDVLVGIYMERSLQMLIALLGVLKAGGAYVPLDPAYPPARLAFLVEESQVAVLVTQPRLVDELPAHNAQVICLSPDAFQRDGGEQQTHNPVAVSLPEHLAYVIYTSGSTGKPKGVAISHQALGNIFNSIKREPGITERDRMLAVTSVSFDIAALELLLPLLVGACVQIVSREGAAEGTELAGQLATSGATIMQATPTTWQMLLSAGWPGDRQLKMLCGGEVLPLELALELGPRGASLWNMYGPTETTIWSTTGEVRGTGERISIGRAIANTQIYLLDQHYMPVPPGVVGELYIGGDGLARGYLHHPEWSAEKFIPNPFSEQAGRRMYHTGDLARWLTDGTIECLGRSDRQVKVRGFRIELGEIEAALGQYPRLRECVVVVRKDKAGEEQLVVYLVNGGDSAPSAGELRSYLQGKLPGYMVPSHFVFLEALPLTPNGKIDRQALPAPEVGKAEARIVVAPRTPIEEMLAEIWGEVLGYSPVGVHENFFEMGGHSLLGTRLMARLQQVLQVKLPLRSLFEAPTVAQLAQQALLALRGQQLEPEPPLLARSRPPHLPLSFAQQRLWFLDQLDPGSTAYLIPNVQRMRGHIDRRALEQSLQQLVQRHESLRVTFTVQADQPVQIIHDPLRIILPVVDLSALALPEREESAQRLMKQEQQQPFDLQRGPLLRVWLLYLAKAEHTMLLAMHHIVSDGLSNEIFARELVILYRAAVAGEPSPLAPLPLQYADYALWQRQWLQGAVLERQLDYWQKQLAELSPLELPTDHLRPTIPTQRGALTTLFLPASLSERLQQLAQQEQVTLFMLLLAAFQVLLSRYSGQRDIAVGTPIANRTHKEVEGLIGFFVNTLVLRSQVDSHLSFIQFLAQVREMALGAYAHQDIPFEQLVEALQPARDLSRSPLFQVMFTLRQPTVATLPLTVSSDPQSPKPSRGLERAHITTKFDLSWDVTRHPHGLSCEVEYNTDLFELTGVQRMLQHWQILLQSIVAYAEQPLACLAMLTEAEKQQMLVQWNNTSRPQPPFSSLQQAIETQVARTPDAIALVFEESCLTYQELNRRADSLAFHLREVGVGPEIIVGVYVERSLELLIGLLAIFKAGGAYTPLDPSSSPEQLRWTLQDAQPAVLLVQHEQVLEWLPPSLRVVVLSNVSEAMMCASSLQRSTIQSSENLAYMLYTSGSTGRPKGVMITQGGVCNHLAWRQAAYPLSGQDVLLQKAPLSFDASIDELFWPLIAGARLVLARPEGHKDSSYLLSLLLEQSVTTLEFVPSLLALLMQEKAWTQTRSLRQVICGGEALTFQVQETFFASHQAELFNTYGPTEATVDACSWACQRQMQGDRLPIGRPIANTETYILDAQGMEVPIGVKGELYIGGVGLGRGYHEKPDLTAQQFIPHPFSQVPGARLYRSGDLARYREDGVIEYLGRVDEQIKLHGVRVEPAEIQWALQQHPRVETCVVVLSQRRADTPQLIAYVTETSEDGGALTREALRSHARKLLPAPLVPSQFILVEALPLTPHGKVDRQKLACMEESEVREETGDTQWSPVEELLGQVWSEVLKTPVEGKEQSFFELGGHSLLATQVVARLRSVLGVEVPVRVVFEELTIAGLARWVEQEQRKGEGMQVPPLVARERSTEPIVLSYAQQRLWFLHQLEPENTAYLIPTVRRLHGSLDRQALERSLQELVQRHESLRTTFGEQAGQPVQIIAPVSLLTLPIVELDGLEAEEREQQGRQLAQQESQLPCDLQRGPLLRIWLVQLAAQEHLLLLTMHHIIADGWSNEIFFQELSTLYQAFVEGRPSPLAPLPIQYADYALWQRQWLQGQVLETQIDYWISRLSGAPLLELPVDRTPRPLAGRRGAVYPFTFSAELSSGLVSLSRRENMTLFMTLLAAFQVLLYRYTGQTDIVLGTDSANRNRAEVEGLIGFFVNVLILRTDLRGKPSFREVLRRVRGMVLDAYAHQETPFELLVEKLATHRALNVIPLIRALFVMQNFSQGAASAEKSKPAAFPQRPAEMPARSSGDESRANKFDLALFVQETAGHIHGTVVYSQALFDAATIATLLARFHVLLESIVQQADASIDLLSFFTSTELTQLEQEEQASRQKLHTQVSEEWFDL